MRIEGDLDSKSTFREAVRARIKVPTIAHLYQRFEDGGLEEVSWEILNNIPDSERRPLLYTLTTHVTKEKPVFIYSIGRHHPGDQDRAQFVAASTDLLWALSLMMDDIVDNDAQRADKDTAWVVYGRRQIEGNIKFILGKLVQAQDQVISPQTAVFLQECVNDGMRSLFAPQIHSLDSTEEDILQNIDQRARFHCEYPMKALFDGGERTSQRAKLGTEALFACNRAGQILNDVKDLVPSSLYGRPLFSDITRGTVTVPLRIMADGVRGADKRLLEGAFGNKKLDTKTLSDLENLLLANLPRTRIHQKVSGIYERFTDIMRLVTDTDDFNICQEWVQYKLSQADRLLLR